ncbi:MAG: hypothetical protein J7621_13020 [Niastella sp.]|nr:hypothetical protein [Niastella sp.]
MTEAKEQLLNEINSKGHKLSNIKDIYSQDILDSHTVEIILKWLPLIYQESLGSGELLVRSLFSAKTPFNPTVLIDLFINSSYNQTIKSTIGLVLAKANTLDISNWLLDQILNKDYSFERAALIDGLENKARITTVDSLIEVLQTIFNKYWWFESYQKLFKKYGRKEDIQFLKSKIDKLDKRMVREISNVINAIDKRVRIHKFPTSNPSKF